MQNSPPSPGLTREKLLNRLEQIIDSPDARDRDVIHAIREANRMLGTYDKPKPASEKPPTNPLREFIAAVRRGDIPQSEPVPEKTTPPPDTSYQITDAERNAILRKPVEQPKTTPPTQRPQTREERDAEQDAKIAASRGRPNLPPSKQKFSHLTSQPIKSPTPTYQKRLNRRRRYERRKQTNP